MVGVDNLLEFPLLLIVDNNWWWSWLDVSWDGFAVWFSSLQLGYVEDWVELDAGGKVQFISPGTNLLQYIIWSYQFVIQFS
jgi:hypothetical protein